MVDITMWYEYTETIKWLRQAQYFILFMVFEATCSDLFNPLALELDIYVAAHNLWKCEYFINQKKGNIMKYTTFCRGINWDCLASLKKYNEI